MAGYAKFWTTMRSNQSFLSLGINARGLYMQLILACKSQRDDGQVWYKNAAQLSQDCGCDARTSLKLLQALSTNVANVLASYTQNDDGTIVITIPNYMKWQTLEAKEVQQQRRKNAAKLQPTRPDQTKPNQTRPNQRKNARAPIPSKQIRELFNQVCTSLPAIDDIEDTRLSHLRARWNKHPDLEWWERFFVTVEASDFLAGRVDTDRRWRCSFDWIIKSANFTKIVEGNYVNKTFAPVISEQKKQELSIWDQASKLPD